MRIVAWLPLSLSMTFGCLQIGTGSTTDGGTPATGSDSGTAASDSGPGGTGCGTDPSTGVTLCLATSACPSFAVNPDAFPGCGFRQGGASPFDLECACPGAELCPIGAPTSCDSAQQLLTQQQSALQVCQQVSTGSCIPVNDAGSGSGSGSSSSGGSSTLSAACMACVSGCGMTPACYEACGC